MGDQARRFSLGLLILCGLVAACGTSTPSTSSLRTKGGPPPTPTALPSSTAAAVGWASLNCGRLDHATCLRIVTMVEDFAPTRFGPTTSVVADYSCPPGAFCEVGFHALVVLIPASKTSGADLAIFDVSGMPDQPETVGLYPYSLPPFMESLLPGPSPSPVLVSAQAAASTAIGSASSTIPVTVVSTKLSTYGAQADGGSLGGPDTPVWEVLLSGSFGFPSCGPATATPHPCPSPATSELVLIDARTGAFIEGLMPAPSGAPNQQSGLVGTVLISGGPNPLNVNSGQVILTASVTGSVVVSQAVESSTQVRIPLPPGEYEISGTYGNVACEGATVLVTAGQFTSFTVVCNIR